MLQFLSDHWDSILLGLAALHTLAVVVTNLTPTPVDDAIVGKVYRAIEVLAGIVTERAKQFPGEEAGVNDEHVDEDEEGAA